MPLKANGAGPELRLTLRTTPFVQRNLSRFRPASTGSSIRAVFDVSAFRMRAGCPESPVLYSPLVRTNQQAAQRPCRPSRKRTHRRLESPTKRADMPHQIGGSFNELQLLVLIDEFADGAQAIRLEDGRGDPSSLNWRGSQ